MKYYLIYSIIIFMSGSTNISGLSGSFKEKNRELRTIEIKSGWQFKAADSSDWLQAVVPGSIHTDLLNNSIISDPFYRMNEKDLQWIDKHDWEYRTSFAADEALLDYENIELSFNGLDTYADIYLNDQKIISADNMFRPWNKECRSFIKPGVNSLRVYFHSPVKIDIPKLKMLGYSLPASNDQSENGGLKDQKISMFARKAPYNYGWDWGPRFVTMGIWRPVFLKAWNNARIESIQFIQDSLNNKTAHMRAAVEIISTVDDSFNIIISCGNEILSNYNIILSEGNSRIDIPFVIHNPELWWPNGLGKPALCKIQTGIEYKGKVIDSDTFDIGIRQIRLVRENTSGGTSFYFTVNGRPVFMKGANYIPQDVFLNRVTPADYEHLIKSAAEANMNMLRVWGGGIYENDLFYDLCDKYGILIWQDFMFACSMYPGDENFLNNVRLEAADNIKRLRNHPSIAVWCGNNEIEDAWNYWGWQYKYSRRQKKEMYSAYKKIFLHILPAAVKEYDGARYYWPSSPGADYGKPSKAGSGDMHYWGVWHGKEPFENFDSKIGRFMSEYGFQSFPELKTVISYTLPEDRDIESPVMAHHQRSGIGNLRIKDYLKRYFRMPKDFSSFLYTGQILQAYGITRAIEAHRRNMPYCMGSLYWQLNDCWPVASWSGIDYYGHLKAVHYRAKHAFEPLHPAPLLRKGSVDFYIISDLLKDLECTMEISIIDFSGKEVFRRSVPVYIVNNTSRSYLNLSVREVTAGQDSQNLVLVTRIVSEGNVLAENLLYFKEPKDLALEKPSINIEMSKTDKGYKLDLKSNKLAKDVCLSLEEQNGFFTDNYFDLLPGFTKTIYIIAGKEVNISAENINIMSLIDSFSVK